jgi:methyl-accepting chemotaxis protein
MQWFKNFNVVAQIISLVIITVFFMIIISITGLLFNKQFTANLNAVYDNQIMPIALISDTRVKMRAEQVDMLTIINTKDSKVLNNRLELTKKRSNDINNNFANYKNNMLSSTLKEKQAEIEPIWKEYQDYKQQVIALVLAGQGQEAVEIYETKMSGLSERILDVLWKMHLDHMEMAKQLNEKNQQDVVTSNRITLMTALFSLLISITSGLWIARLIGKPIKEVTQALIRVSEGNIRISDVNVCSQNEMGKLTIALNKMKNDMGSMIRKIITHTEQVAIASQDLTAGADQSTQAAGQVSTAIDRVKASTEKQMKVIDASSSAMSRLSQGVQQIADNVNVVSTTAIQSSHEAQKGNQAVEKTITQMENIKKTVNNSAQLVVKLGDRSKEISQIVDTISGIAGQTNLLALNAAIEAARAGESGKGFAVVAEEVRKLAEQSQNAAKQIADLIKGIQKDTDNAVYSMSQGTHEVKVGTEVVITAGVVFKDIAVMVTKVSDQVQDISTTIRDMAGNSQEILSSMQEINQHSKKMVREAQTVSAATEEQLASMEEITVSSQSLAGMSGELQEVTNHFNV